MGTGTLALALLVFQSSTGNPQVAGNTVVVSVAGIKSSAGQIGCALFRSAEGFPLKSESA